MVLLLFFYNIVIKVYQFFLLFSIGLGTLIGNCTGKGVCVCVCVYPYLLWEKTQIKVTSNTAILCTDFGNDIDCTGNGGILRKTLPFF